MGTWFDIVVPYFKVTRELTSLLECFLFQTRVFSSTP